VIITERGKNPLKENTHNNANNSDCDASIANRVYMYRGCTAGGSGGREGSSAGAGSGGVEGECFCLEGFEGVGAGLDGVDAEDHAALAVGDGGGLCAVGPEGGGVVDLDGHCRESGSVSGDGHESRVEASGSGGADGERCAGISKGTLSDGMVLLVELEGDSVSDLGSDIGGGVSERAVVADDDEVVSGHGGGWGSGARVRRVGSGDSRVSGDSDGCSDGDDRGGRGGRGVGTHGGSLELGEFGVGAWVDGEDHAFFAVPGLTAVDPNRICVSDGKLGAEEAASGIGVDRNKSRIETVCKRRAR